MPANPPIEELRQKFSTWMDEQALASGLSKEVTKVYELANPVGMSAAGYNAIGKNFAWQIDSFAYDKICIDI